MRFFRLLLMVIGLSVTGLAHAQSRPDTQPAMSEEVNLVKSVHLFPNPATEFIDVKLDQLPASSVSLTVHNIIGNELQVETEVLEEDQSTKARDARSIKSMEAIGSCSMV